jgi:hypothetical protein
MEQALSPAVILYLNLAPAQGLFLDMRIFEGYDSRKANSHLEDLDWMTDETAPAVQRWKDFRENVVMKHIGQEEAAQGHFIRYLYVHQEHVYHTTTRHSTSQTHTNDKGSKGESGLRIQKFLHC